MGETRQGLGRRGEDMAESHLASLGMVVIDRNWHAREGEIDLVARDERDGAIVFCEVKLRTGVGYGDPLEALTFEKVRRMRRLAGAWMAAHPHVRGRPRLDAVGVLARPGCAPIVRHVQGIDS